MHLPSDDKFVIRNCLSCSFVLHIVALVYCVFVVFVIVY